MRDDVKYFANDMSAAMESKKVERDSREDPHYMSPAYSLEHAFACLRDKVEQLEWHTLSDNLERGHKTAVHMANFCMVIASKIAAGHKLDDGQRADDFKNTPFITLTTSDTDDRFRVRIDQIVAMYRSGPSVNQFTIIHYSTHRGGNWCVKESPEEIEWKICQSSRRP